MRRSSFIGSVQGAAALHRSLSDQNYAAKSRREAEDQRHLMNNAEPSNRLGHGRLGTLVDAAKAKLLKKTGLFLGALHGKLLFYSGDSHLLTYARTGGGKGVTMILPNLAHVRGRSLIVVDVKDGENAWASWKHRSETLGEKCIFLNPFNLHGLPNTCINPLRLLVDIIEAGGTIDTQASELALLYIPEKKGEGKNAWVSSGARRWLATRMEYLAIFEPEMCTPGGLWRFLNASSTEVEIALVTMAECDRPGIEGRAGDCLSTFRNAPEQYEAYKSAIADALAAYEPGKALEVATSRHEFDAAKLKDEPHTVYVMSRSDKIGVAGQWMSGTVHYFIERIAQHVGPVRTTILADEFAMLPQTPVIPKAIRLYRGKGINFWIFAQGPFSLEARWSREEVREFEDQADVLNTWSVDDPDLIKKITLWSGTSTITTQNLNHGGGVVETAGANLSETSRPVLQTEDVRGIGMNLKQIIRVAGVPYLFIADRVPFFKVDPWRDQIRDVRDLHFHGE